MKTFVDQVTSLTDGRKVQARIAQCDCDSTCFGLFQIVGQDHFHVQCKECGKSYCPGGSCKAPAKGPQLCPGRIV